MIFTVCYKGDRCFAMRLHSIDPVMLGGSSARYRMLVGFAQQSRWPHHHVRIPHDPDC